MILPQSETAPLRALAGFFRDEDEGVVAFVVAEQFECLSQGVGAGAGEADGYDIQGPITGAVGFLDGVDELQDADCERWEEH